MIQMAVLIKQPRPRKGAVAASAAVMASEALSEEIPPRSL